MARTKPTTDTEAKATRAVNGPRGWLATEVQKVCQAYADGKIDLDGKPLTPHRVAKLVHERTGAASAPSTGAVSAVFKRWDDFGFAKFTAKPFGFKSFTPKGQELGLGGLIEARRDRRKADRAKAKKAAAKAEAVA